MNIDARFDRIQKIIPIENSDNLEQAIVSNFPCVVHKGEFKEGDWCFYIRDDAKLIGFDEYRERIDRDHEAAKTGAMVSQDCFTCSFPWQNPLLKYLGSGGRVKSIRLRGAVSMGILLKPNTVCLNIENSIFSEVEAGFFNNNITDPENGAKYLEKNFGVKHWTASQTNIGDLNTLHCGLEDGIRISDETNWENLPESDLHIGNRCLVTKKLDGTSCSVICRTDGTFAVTTRHNTLRPECDNIYTQYTKEAVKAGLWYAKTYNCVIAFQGEICCTSVQRMGINKDKNLNDYFIYKCYFPQAENWHLKMGTYGTKAHFMDVVNICNNEGGFNLKTVPIIGEDVVSKELLKKYNDMPADWGEGVVINVKVEDCNIMSSVVWDYKSKSREYLMKIK